MEIKKYDLVSTEEGDYGMVLGKDSNDNLAIAVISNSSHPMDGATVRVWRNQIREDWNVKNIILVSPSHLDFEKRYRVDEVYHIRNHGLGKVFTVRKGYVCFIMIDGSGNTNPKLTFPIMRLHTEC